jgi:hypothetical protein
MAGERQPRSPKRGGGGAVRGCLTHRPRLRPSSRRCPG